MRKLLLLIILLQSTKSFSQLNLTRKLDVNVKSIALYDFLNKLQAEHRMLFSYAFDNTDDQCLVSIQATDVSMIYVLDEVARQCNLEFIIIGESVVFKKKTKSAVSSEVVTHTYSPAIYSPPVWKDSGRVSMTNWLARFDLKIDSARFRRYILALKLPHQKKTTGTQPIKASYGLFVHYALDVNSYDFKPRDLDFQTYRSRVNNGFGIGFFHRFATRWFVSIGVTAVKKNFTLHYKFRAFDPDDPLPIPAHTILDIQYIETPVSFGYSFFTRPKNALWIFGSIVYSSVTSKTEKTTYLNSGKTNTSFFLGSSPSYLLGTSAGIVFHQDITASSGIFIESSYMMYTSAMNQEAMYSSRAFRIRAGLAYKLKKY